MSRAEVDVSEAAKAKALEAFRAEGCSHIDGYIHGMYGFQALARFIQEVSDAAKLARDYIASRDGNHHADFLAPFILPEPADPFAEAVEDAHSAWVASDSDDTLPVFVRAELARRGIQIGSGNE